MQCPHTHLLYELERGTAPREEAEALRQHLSECSQCRQRVEAVRDVAAGLEQLADHLRHELPEFSRNAILRRARTRGLVGRRIRPSLLVRMQRSPAARIAVSVGMLAAAVLLIVIAVRSVQEPPVVPQGSLQDLQVASVDLNSFGGIAPLALAARAAVTEELSRPSPSLEQVGDLLLVTYIAQYPKEQRQIDDVRFLVAGAWSRKLSSPSVASAGASWPMLASVALAQAETSPSGADATAAGRALMLKGDYEAALASLPIAPSASVARAWCLVCLNRSAEADNVLKEADRLSPSDMIRLMRANLALQNHDVGQALQGYEALAAKIDRFWFTAGYICRYEQADAEGAGRRFQRIKNPEMASYVANKFKFELAAAQPKEREVLLTEDFDGYDEGVPNLWTLVQAHDSEFHVVQVPHGRALQQDEVNFRGAEFLTGDEDWADYTLQFDVKVLKSHGNYTIGAAAYRKSDDSGYVLELSQDSLRITRQFASRLKSGRHEPNKVAEPLKLGSALAEAHLGQPPAVGWWYTLKIRVQKVEGGVNVAGKCWRSDIEEPLQWQVVWTDTGQAGGAPVAGGCAGAQVSGVKVLIDNFIVLRNEAPKKSE
jgi:hypothetical protein